MAPKTKAPNKENALTSKEVAAIIRICSHSGVAELNFGNLQIKFGLNPKPIESKPPNQATADVEISEQQHKELTKHAIEADEVRLKEDRIAFAMVDNPSLAEALLEDGEFLDDDELDSGGDGESTGVG